MATNLHAEAANILQRQIEAEREDAPPKPEPSDDVAALLHEIVATVEKLNGASWSGLLSRCGMHLERLAKSRETLVEGYSHAIRRYEQAEAALAKAQAAVPVEEGFKFEMLDGVYQRVGMFAAPPTPSDGLRNLLDQADHCVMGYRIGKMEIGGAMDELQRLVNETRAALAEQEKANG